MTTTPKTITFEGKDYRVGPIDDEVKALFVQHLKRAALLEIRKVDNLATEAEYHALLAGWRHDVAAGEFEWGQPTCVRAVLSPSGAQYLCHLTLVRFDAMIPQSVAARMYESEAAWTAWTSAVGEVPA